MVAGISVFTFETAASPGSASSRFPPMDAFLLRFPASRRSLLRQTTLARVSFHALLVLLSVALMACAFPEGFRWMALGGLSGVCGIWAAAAVYKWMALGMCARQWLYPGMSRRKILAIPVRAAGIALAGPPSSRRQFISICAWPGRLKRALLRAMSP